jgi:hypothetical protein
VGVYGASEKNPTILHKLLENQLIKTIRLNSLQVVATLFPVKAGRLSPKRPFM